MISSKYLIPLLTCSALALSISPAWGESDTISEITLITFACEDNQGVPITVAKNNEGKTQTVFNWRKEDLPASVNPQEMCADVAERFNDYAADGNDLSSFVLQPMKLDTIPMICVTTHGNCELVLFILPPTETEKSSQEAHTVLKKILAKDIFTTPNERGVSVIDYSVNLF